MWQQEVQSIHLARCKLAPEIPLPSVSRTIITMRLDVPLQRLVLLKHVIREIQFPDACGGQGHCKDTVLLYARGLMVTRL